MTLKLIDSLYTEALVLADEARGYFDETCLEDKAALDPQARVLFSCEAIKVTTRLMYIVTWLLSARAELGGVIRRIEFVPPSSDTTRARLPVAAVGLISATEQLYARTIRLQSRARAAPMPSPVRQLLTQLGAAF